MTEWNDRPHWTKLIERRVHEALALAKGIGLAHADRISDVVEQIDELRKELQEVKDRQDKIANYLKKHHKNGDAP